MNRNELRFGNYIRFNEYFDGELMEPNEKALDEEDMWMLWDDGLPDISPIPLTEEWLRRLGFSDKNYKEGYIGIDVGDTDFVLNKPHDNWLHFGWDFKYGGWPRQKSFEFVHELQNFFFVLTGKELELKPTAE